MEERRTRPRESIGRAWKLKRMGCWRTGVCPGCRSSWAPARPESQTRVSRLFAQSETQGGPAAATDVTGKAAASDVPGSDHVRSHCAFHVRVVLVLAPLESIADHVVEAVRVGLESACTRGERMPVIHRIDPVFRIIGILGPNALVRAVAEFIGISFIVAPVKASLRSGPAGELPFHICWQTEIRRSRILIQPHDKSLRVAPANRECRMVVSLLEPGVFPA